MYLQRPFPLFFVLRWQRTDVLLRIPSIMYRLLNFIINRAERDMTNLVIGAAVPAASLRWHFDHTPPQSALCNLLQSLVLLVIFRVILRRRKQGQFGFTDIESVGVVQVHPALKFPGDVPF